MKLYAITVSAVRDLRGEKPEITLQNVVALLSDDMPIEESAIDHARHTLLVSEGWEDHQVLCTEIESGHQFGPYRLTWRVEELAHA